MSDPYRAVREVMVPSICGRVPASPFPERVLCGSVHESEPKRYVEVFMRVNPRETWKVNPTFHEIKSKRYAESKSKRYGEVFMRSNLREKGEERRETRTCP